MDSKRNERAEQWRRQNRTDAVLVNAADGSRSQNKSTGTKDRKEAESIAMRWAILGDIPERINSKAEKAKSQSVDRISLFNSDWKPFSL